MHSPISPPEIEFDQTESITSRLRDLVRNYPKGLGLVKEFLQNADDAGASSLVLIYDHRIHDGMFENPAMNVVLGPSLLFINDRSFSDDDFQRIQQIGEGGKVREAARTGRFGQGFNTCYSTSDHPSLITGDRVAWFDPHHFVFDKKKNARAWSLSIVEQNWPDWLKTFVPAGWKAGMQSFPGTVFRLPLRSEADAEKSEILPEAFSDNDFSAILQELHLIGAALLVFLRSVSKLEIKEIDINGKEHLRFRIATKNDVDVDQHRLVLRQMVDGNPKDLLLRWKKSHEALPFIQYEHVFELFDIDGSQYDEVWGVTTGLFKGPEGVLLDKALDVCEHHEKAIPWAGAAVRKNISDSISKNGGIACFLPLPEATKWPVWLHGWFDLSSNRRGITRSAEAGDTTKARFSWNQALMEHAVGKAWALLIHYVHGNPDENTKPYDYWLRPSEKPDAVELSLITGFYQSISQLEVIRAREANSHFWYRLDKIRADLPSDWFKRLIDPLIAEGWILSDPPLPQFVKDGFKKVKKQPQSLSSKILRYELRIPEAEADIACPLEGSSRPMLRKREWIYSIAEFCSDGDWSNLSHLPLAILSDGLLHTFTTCGKIFLAGNEERLLLDSLPERFLDIDYQSSIKLDSPAEEINLFNFDLSGLLEFVPEIISRSAPDRSWLIRFFDYLTSCDEATVEANKDSLNELQLIADQNGSFCQMGLIETPLIPGKVSKELRDALVELGIPILTVYKDVELVISRFASKHAGHVWELTPNDIAYNLKSHVEESCLNEASLDNRKTLEPLLDFLSSTTWLNEIDDRLPLLRQVRLLPTTCNQRVAAQDDSVYIPSGFTPPEGIGGQYRLLDLGEGKAWQSFYKILGVPTLDGITFVNKVLLPAFSSADLDQCKAFLVWIRDEFRLVEREINEEQRNKLRDKIRQSPIIPLEGGGFLSPRYVYRPGSTEPIELLQEYARVPDKEFFSTDKDLWEEFFEEFRLPTKPLARDIYSKISALADEAKDSGVGTVKTLLRKLLDHLRERWKILSDITVVGSSSLAEALSKLAWLTATSDGGTIYAASSKWPEQLWRANELVPARYANLVASRYPILEGNELPFEMSEALGLIKSVNLNDVLEHFTKVLTHPIVDDKNIDAVNRAAEGFYRFIGQSELDKVGQIQISVKGLSEQQCIFISGQWWYPSQCFFELPSFVTGWAVSFTNSDLRVSELSVRRGLELLGVRPHPDRDDWIQMLSDFFDEYIGKPLPPSELNQVHHVIRLLRSESTEWLRTQNVFIPLIDGRLEDACSALVLDDPRLKNISVSIQLPLIEDNEDAYDVGYRAGAKSLRGSLIDRLTVMPATTQVARHKDLAVQLESNIRSKQFYECLQRIAYDEALNDRNISADPFEAAFAEQLKLPQKMRVNISPLINVETIVEIDDEEIVVFLNDAASFLEAEIPRLWLKEGKPRRIRDETVRAICIICGLTSQLIMSRVLEADNPDFMHKVLDEEEVATLPKGQTIDLESAPEPLVDEDGLDSTIVVDYVQQNVLEVTIVEDDVEGMEEVASTALETIDEFASQKPESALITAESRVVSPFPISNQPLDSTISQASKKIEPPTRPGHGSSSPWQEQVPNDNSVTEQSTEKTTVNSLQPVPDWLQTTSGKRNGASPQHVIDLQNPISARTSSPDGPPTKPGDGSSRPWDGSIKTDPDKTKQIRLRTYVHEKIHDDYDTGDADSHAKELGNAGEEIVMAYEKKHRRIALKMPINHEGYDVESKCSQGIRYIEVKSIDGPWGDRGVGVTRAQYEAALRLGDKWWLYVVEHVSDIARANVHPIANPFHLATEYRFDSGWKSLIDNGSGGPPISANPHIGASYERELGDIVKIEGLTQHGEFWRVRYSNPDGSKQSAIWNAAWIKV